MNENTMLQQTIGAMIMADAIKFEAYSWCFGYVDMKICTKVFTDEEFVMSVKEDDWNGGPAASVAAQLTQLVLQGELTFRPVQEQH